MAKKRGGLAGIWDRNKQFITPAAEALAGAFGGPYAAAGLGALIGGLDRPGQHGLSGFGMKDVGRAALGGATGYGMGQLGSAAKTGLSSLFTGGAPVGAASPAGSPFKLTAGIGEDVMGQGAGQAAGAGFSIPEALPKVPPVPSLPAPPSAASLAPSVSRLSMAGAPPASMPMLQTAGSALSDGSFVNQAQVPWYVKAQQGAKSAMDFADKHDKATSLALQGVGKFLASPESRALELKSQVEQDRLNFEKQQYEEEKQRKQRLAQLLIPMYQQYMPGMTSSMYRSPLFG